MAKDHDKNPGDQNTFDGGAKRDDSSQTRGLGMEDTKSLWDHQATFGDAGGNDEPFDDGMEVVDLSARYTTEGTLGKGGMGEVLLALDTRLKRKVAIKRVLGKMARSQTALSRFSTEAQSIAALNHPNIVQIHDYGRDEDGPFLIMEYVDGGSLLEKCKEGALELEEAVELTCQLCDGLGKAHEAGIIHRDIKPDNVLLTNDGTPKLTDFGLARQDTADHGQTQVGSVLGTIDFMPPEQRLDATQMDARSDLWSLAATLYQMVTGRSPKIIKFNNVPQALQDVLGKALEDEKDDRYQTAREFRDALRASQSSTAGEVELEEGDCPSCGTKNPTHRKFCKNPDCSASLEVPCLSCSSKIPMWEQVCDSCGTPQRDLLKQRRSQMVSGQAEAESSLKGYDFDGAKTLAVALRDESDLRLQHLKGWAEEFLPKIEQGCQQQLEQIGGQLAEAAAHEQAHDYTAGLRVLEQVPEILRETEVSGDTVTGVMSRLQSTLDEIKRLIAEIRQRVKTRKVNGLLSEVNQLLKLQPDRKDIRKLKTQLLEHEGKLKETRDEAYTAAKQKLSAQDYDGVLEEIARINESVMREEITQLRDEAAEKRDRLKTLHAAISEGVKEKKLHGLLMKVDECLSLKSGDAELQKLRGQSVRALAAFEQALEDQQEAGEAADRQRALMKKLAIAGAAVTAVVLLIAAGLWIGSAIGQAMNRGEQKVDGEDQPKDDGGDTTTMVMQEANGCVNLTPVTAKLHGDNLVRESDGLNTIVTNWSTTDQWVEWKFTIAQTGLFTVQLTYAATASAAGSSIMVEIGDEKKPWEIRGSNGDDSFITDKLIMAINAPGEHRLILRAKHLKGPHLMKLKSVDLIPKGS